MGFNMAGIAEAVTKEVEPEGPNNVFTDVVSV